MNVPPPLPYSPRPKRRLRLFVVLAILMAGAGWYFFLHHSGGDAKGPPAVAVRTAPASRQTVPMTVQAVGTVVAYETVALRSRIDSQVTKVLFKDGDEVKAGQLLFELDDTALRAQAAQMSANISRDQAQLENARRQSGRAAALAAKGFATKATRDDTRAAEQMARASVSASNAELDNARALIGYTRIVAPISGRTGTINVTLGNTVKANDTTPLVTINQVKPIRVQAALPQTLFDEVRSAMQNGTVTVQAFKQDEDGSNGPLAEGVLEYIDNAVNQSTGTFVTRAGFANADERLWPGMFVTLSLTLGTDENALTVPEVAIQRGQAGDYVFVIAGDKAQRRDVKVARLQNNLAVIREGVQEGETVAIDGMLGLKDGSHVTVAKDAEPKPEATPEAAKAP